MQRIERSSPTETRAGARRSHRRLHTSALFTIQDTLCRRPVGEIGVLDEVEGLEILLPRRGSWLLHAGGEATLVDPNHVALLVPDRAYRNSHPRVVSARSTSIAVTPDGLRELLAGADAPSFPPERAHVVVSRDARADLLHRRLVQRAGEGAGDLAVEELTLRLVAWLLREAGRAPRARGRPGIRRRHRELVEEAKALLNRALAEPPSLVGLARALRVSPSHLSRLFAAHTGTSVYRYFLRLRLAAVMERVLGGAELTAIAMELGFADHSHLTNQFRRELGIAPSRLRRPAGVASLRDELALLERGARPSA